VRRLAGISEQPERIDGILVTHEHSDHICGLARVARRLDVPVYATRATACAVDWGEYAPKLEIFQAGARLFVGDIEIDSFTVPHDAADPVGFCFRSQGIKIGLVTDLGYMPESIRYQLRGTTALVLESNHDLEMLKVGPYPWSVKQRVMSRVGHLSNEMACEFLSADLDSVTATLILAHLSEHNNHPEIVRMFAADALARRGVKPQLVVAQQGRPTEMFNF
jgi:phosphoribosyl 1,2-cyclic phosphodiesterase